MRVRSWLPIIAAVVLLATSGLQALATGENEDDAPLTLAQSPSNNNQQQAPDYDDHPPPEVCYEKVNQGDCDCMSFKVSGDGQLEAKGCVAETYCTSLVSPC
jgi:hypothetical protein